MRPTLRQLQYLVAVADTGKFHEAARLLNVSQPSLSAQIAEAEHQLGAVLVERGRHGAFMTPLGEEVVRRARAILIQVEDLKAFTLRPAGEVAGRYRLGTVSTIGPYLLPGAVRELHRLFPELRMSVHESRIADLNDRLNDGRLDMIISTPEDHASSAFMELFEETLYVCAAQEDELSAEKGPVDVEALRGRELLSLGPGHRLSLIIQQLADAAGAHVSTEYEGTSLDAVRQTASMGEGVAILPNLYAVVEAKRDPSQVVRPIRHKLARRKIGLIWREGSPLSEPMTEMGKVMRAVAAELLSSDGKEPKRRVSRR
ncbi:LysR substrate-binding domain-containing protein [Hyphomonas jannaschiana]|uniref:LysR family transcriptional regulator n=1 Tax=Hyphomonas jannaschiana VP2 TaxID=1280952 RepID=A0A059FED7_9PROT|nr:LysR substrate-binding domain-containing protein [Hyphomonas jannaschiana]KCZ88979.1 LysR family transcriptional regulator [Hyphomonas jannaschiana VP2]